VHVDEFLRRVVFDVEEELLRDGGEGDFFIEDRRLRLAETPRAANGFWERLFTEPYETIEKIISEALK